MPASFRMNLGPDVKLGLTQRGNVRIGLGPRAARVHVGTGSPPSLSSGVGGFQYWSGPLGKPRSRARAASSTTPPQRRSAPVGPALKAKGEAMLLGMAVEGGVAIGSAAFHAIGDEIERRRERREEKAALIEALEVALVTAHRQEFEQTAAPERRQPPPVDRADIRRACKEAALEPLAWWQLLQRQRAVRASRVDADRWSDEEAVRREAVAKRTYERACRLWEGLQVNDRAAVLDALEHAFEDNAVPAFAIDCAGSVASVAMVTGPSDSLPDETVERDNDGRPKFREREHQKELHRDSVFSNVLATAKETFAVAPFLSELQLVCLERTGGSILRKRDRLVPICLLRASRAEIAALDWSAPLATTMRSIAVCEFRFDDDRRGLQPVDLDEHPDVEQVMREFAEALDCRF